MVGKVENVSIELHAGLFQRLPYTPDVPVEILNLGIVACQFAACLLLDSFHRRNVRTQFELAAVVVAHEFRRRNMGIVRGLDGNDGKERLALPRFHLFAAFLQVFDQQVGEFIGFIARQPILECVLSGAAMHPAVPLAVVVFIANPVVETTTPVGRNNVQAGAAVALFPLFRVGEYAAYRAGVVEGSVGKGVPPAPTRHYR
jgi:hypothetical protein